MYFCECTTSYEMNIKMYTNVIILNNYKWQADISTLSCADFAFYQFNLVITLMLLFMCLRVSI